MIRLLAGDCRDILPTLPAESVQCVVTSPPYYGLRDYGTALWDGGSAACDHAASYVHVSDKTTLYSPGEAVHGAAAARYGQQIAKQFSDVCGKCGAVRVDRQIGLEATPDEYLATMVAVFREIKRVLRPDGTCWVNMGDSYASNPSTARGGFDSHRGSDTPTLNTEHQGRNAYRGNGIKAKDLLLMPARLALALQADGWWVRSEITWCKKNPMPESVRDRPSSATEKIYLLTKSPRYFYDPVSIAEACGVDADAVAEYRSGYAPMHNLPDRTGRKQLPSREAGEWRTDPRLQVMQHSQGSRVEGDAGGQREFSLGMPTAQRQAGAPSEAGRISPVGQDEGVAGGVADNAERYSLPESLPNLTQAQGGEQALLRERQGQSADRAVSGDREGQGISGARSSQASRVDEDQEHADGGGVEGDQGECATPLPLLPEGDEALDDGSRNPVDEGWPSHSVEHRSSVPELQRAERQQGATPAVRNARNWWLMSTYAFPSAHFATFPPELAERCIKAGTSERGCCAACGKPWVRITETAFVKLADRRSTRKAVQDGANMTDINSHNVMGYNDVTTTGWAPGCQCDAGVAPCVVLDPFIGAGTTALVADRLQRDVIGIDLNVGYTRMAMDRCIADAPLFTSFPPAEPPEDMRMADLFAGDEYERVPAAVRRDNNRDGFRGGSGPYVNQGPSPSNGLPDMAAD